MLFLIILAEQTLPSPEAPQQCTFNRARKFPGKRFATGQEATGILAQLESATKARGV